MRTHSYSDFYGDRVFPYGLVYGILGAVSGLAGVWLSTAFSWTHFLGA